MPENAIVPYVAILLISLKLTLNSNFKVNYFDAVTELRYFAKNSFIMYIYNVTSNIEDSIHEQWLAWIKEHIPQVLSTGKFKTATLTRVLVEEEMGGVTYSVQYRAISREALDEYFRDHAAVLRNDAVKRFGDKVLSFRTELQIVDEYTVDFK